MHCISQQPADYTTASVGIGGRWLSRLPQTGANVDADLLNLLESQHRGGSASPVSEPSST